MSRLTACLSSKRTILSIVLSFLFFSFVSGDEVSSTTAQKAAINWYRHYAPESKKAASVTKAIPYQWNERTSFYICSFDKGGFVLVSANDAVTPILGYGFDHSAPDEITNEAVKGWFDNYARQIDTAFVLNLKNEEMTEKWQEVLENRIPVKDGKSVGPLLTTTWDQGCYYNEMCPEDLSGICGHTWVGCTATAMAQILKYWNYPEGGIGYHSYMPKYNIQYGRQTVFFNETNYDWTTMLDYVSSQNESVATLMYHAGVSAEMNYSTSGSGAYLYKALIGFKKNFDYSDSILQIYRSELTESAWTMILQNNINLGRPTLIDGYNASHTLGHAFVCDGYDNQDLFHINWGWSGSYNGYWNFDNLVVGWYNFNYNQSAIINIFPNNSLLTPRFFSYYTDTSFQVQFYDNSLKNPDSFIWNFGDSTSSILQNPIHLFSEHGNYNITFTIIKDDSIKQVIENIEINSFAFSKLNSDIGGSDGDINWVNYDNDGDLDALISGYPLGTKLYQNNNGVFTEVNSGIIGNGINFQPTAKIGDVDNDGDVDVLLCIDAAETSNYSKLYLNESGVYEESSIVIPANVHYWKDFDGDGDLDIMTLTHDGFRIYLKIYEFINGNYYLQNHGMQDVLGIYTEILWIDWNNDGDLDIFFYGKDPNLAPISKLFIFDNKQYEAFTLNIPVFDNRSLDFKDFDKDGDLDLLLFANSVNTVVAKVYRNVGDHVVEAFDLSGNYEWLVNYMGISAQWIDYNLDGYYDVALTEHYYDNGISEDPNITVIYQNIEGEFYDINAQDGINYGNSNWFDYDNDGDLDILDLRKSRLFKKENNSFVPVSIDILENGFYSSAIGDYDDDKDIDLLLTGYGYNFSFTSNIFRNNSITKNLPPSVPSGFNAITQNNDVEFEWNHSNDDKTPQNHITYNIYIGTSPETVDILSPLSDLVTGKRLIVDQGNIGNRNSYTFKNLPNGTYFAGIQSLDHSFSSSVFSDQIQFTITGQNLPPSLLDSSKEIYLNNLYQFNKADFGLNYFDPENDTLTKIMITSLPQYGELMYNNTMLTIGQEILIDEISNLSYLTNNLHEDSFSWKASDGTNYSLNPVSYEFIIKLFKKVEYNFNGIFRELSKNNSSAWLDFDNDGDLDIILLVQTENLIIPKLFLNDNGNFLKVDGVLPEINTDAFAVGDYDNDNFIDIVLIGSTPSGEYTEIYRNNNGIFENTNSELIGVRGGMLEWIDFDNDGDLDLTLCGIIDESNIRVSKIYKNENGYFVDINAELPGVNAGSISWGDYNNDGYPDLLITGSLGSYSELIAKLYRNENGQFVESGSFNNFFFNTSEWADFDQDGDIDFLISGMMWIYDVHGTRIMKNNNGVFSEYYSPPSLTGDWDYMGGSSNWIDFDNDGDFDVVIVGKEPNGTPASKFYKNYGNSYYEFELGFITLDKGISKFADYDNDGDLDALLLGVNLDGSPFSGLLQNCFESNQFGINYAPDVISSLNSSILENRLSLSWNLGNDQTTPQSALTYNIYVQKQGDSSFIVSPMADTTSGYRKVLQRGNTSQNNYWYIDNLPPGTYYWSVQAIDNSFTGGPFAPKQTFTICNQYPEAAGEINGSNTVCASSTNIVYSIDPIQNATSYQWNLPPGVTGSSSTNSITVNFGAQSESGEITVKGVNECGEGESASLLIEVNPLPLAAGEISGSSIVCQGNNLVTYTVPIIGNATSYSWTLPNGASGISTTNSISVDYSNSATSGNITVIGINSCGEGAGSTLPITVNPAPMAAGVISGSSIVCQGQNAVVYTVSTIANATSYIWTLPNGASGTSTTNSISVDYSSSSTSGNISVKGINSCGEGTGSALPITVNTAPMAAGPISGSSIVCQGQNAVVYTVPAIANAASYMWTLPNGAIGTSMTNSITVDFSASATSGNITVKGINSCGEGAGSILPISVNRIPMAAGVISGSSIVCQGQNAVSYTVPAIANATSYIWTLPNGASGTSAINSISVNFGSNAESGEISVSGVNECGEGEAASLLVEVNPLPDAAHSINGPTEVCAGAASILYSTPTIAHANSYNWTLPQGFFGNSTTSSISVYYANQAQSGTITVNGVNECGEGEEASLFVQVNPLPEDPPIPMGPDEVDLKIVTETVYKTQQVQNASEYFWELEPFTMGEISSQGDSAIITWSGQLGAASLRVSGWNSNCEFGPWSEVKSIWVDNTIGIDESGIKGVVMFPNPSDGVFTVKSEFHIESMLMKDATGKTVLRPKLVDSYQIDIDANDLAKGIYFIEITHRYGNERLKLILIEK